MKHIIHARFPSSLTIMRPAVRGVAIRNWNSTLKNIETRNCMDVPLKPLGADVARFLGVTNSCVTRLISTGGKQDIDDMDLEL